MPSSSSSSHSQATGRLRDGREIAVVVMREDIVVETLAGGHHETDPDWTATDSSGHRHDATLETLEEVGLGEYWCDMCRDTHEDHEWRCRACGEKVEPGHRWVNDLPTRYQGPPSATVTITGGGARAVYAARAEDLLALPVDSWLDVLAERVEAREPLEATISG